MSMSTVQLPLYSAWTDGDLAKSETRDFAEMLYTRAWSVAKDLYDSDAYELVDMDPRQKADRLVFYLRRRAWAEWYFGTVTPARQITLLPDDQVNLRLRLARQVADEMRHHDVFAGEVHRRGGEAQVSQFPAPKALREMQSAQVNSETAADLAAANQYSGEIVLLITSYSEGNILRLLVDDQIFSAIQDIETDEPAHVAIGCDLVKLYSETPDRRRRLAFAQEQFLSAQISQHASELEMLGSRRVRPLPSFK